MLSWLEKRHLRGSTAANVALWVHALVAGVIEDMRRDARELRGDIRTVTRGTVDKP